MSQPRGICRLSRDGARTSTGSGAMKISTMGNRILVASMHATCDRYDNGRIRPLDRN